MAYTPKKTGLTASSWNYKIEEDNGSVTLSFYNDDVEGGENVAILLQYGHGTNNGGYVEGIDYINPAVSRIFDDVADSIVEEVNKY